MFYDLLVQIAAKLRFFMFLCFFLRFLVFGQFVLLKKPNKLKDHNRRGSEYI